MLYDETTLQPIMPPPSSDGVKTNGVHDVDDELKTPILQIVKKDRRVIVGFEEGITVTNATARWTDQLSDDTLSHINLRVVPGNLTAVIGPVGSGKVGVWLKQF